MSFSKIFLPLCKINLTFKIMNSNLLFPHKYKKWGWLLFSTSFLLLCYLWLIEFDFDSFLKVKTFAIINDASIMSEHKQYFSLIENGILDELLTIFAIIGGLLIVFSKTKIEDEMVNKIRLESLMLATYINYAFIILTTIFIYGFSYLTIIMLNLFTIIVFFIIIFHYKLKKLNTL